MPWRYQKNFFLIILKFQTSPKFAQINMRLCGKKVTTLIFSIFNIVHEKLFHKSDGVHTKLDVRLYLCKAFTYRAKFGTLSSQAWPEGTCTVSGKCHLLVKKCEKLIFEVILLIPFYTTLPKRTTIMLQTNPTLLVGLARLHNCCLHVSYWNHHNRIYCHLVPRKNKSLNQPIDQRLWELCQINTGLKLKRKSSKWLFVLWC